MNREMKTLVLFLCLTVALFAFSGCAYKGAVFIYSPVGDANDIDRATDFDAGASLMGL